LFLKVFGEQKRESMADYFCELQKDAKKWRIRELIAGQIEILATIFSTETVFRIIAPISFKLCADPVSIVREKASLNIYTVLNSLYNTEGRDPIIENIKGFSQANRFTNRQAFVFMCDKLMDQIEIFEKNFLKCLISIGDDKVPNVRLCLSRLLKKKFEERCPMVFNKEVMLLIQKLQIDKSKDVRIPVEDIVLPLPEELIINSPLKKSNPSIGNSSPSKIQRTVQAEESSVNKEITKIDPIVEEANGVEKDDEKRNGEIIEVEKKEDVDSITSPQEIVEETVEKTVDEETVEEKIEEKVEEKIEEKVEEKIEEKIEEKAVENIKEKLVQDLIQDLIDDSVQGNGEEKPLEKQNCESMEQKEIEKSLEETVEELN